jgi:stage V sporulation protein G
MVITSVTVKKLEKENSRMRGLATIVLDDAFAIHDIRIIEGENGLWVAMPSRKTATGEYRDVAHPINIETRKMFEDAIFEEYNKAE